MEMSMQRNIERLEKVQSDILVRIRNINTLSVVMANDIMQMKQEISRIQKICSPPCENGGQCEKNVCNCPPSFTGDRCQQAVCIPPCENRGHCMENNVCNCTPLFTGDRCQDVLCNPPCENGGQCMTNNACECRPSFTGDRCQQALCSPPCRNGGQCTRDNVCNCPSSFYGDRCQDGPLCGIDFDNDVSNAGENTSSVLVWPWMAAVNKNRTYTDIIEPAYTERVCDGSVIHRHFVLTSAFCVTWYGSEGLSVQLGLSDVKNGTHFQEYQVRSVHIHPQFDGQSYYNYDYGIALLKVEEPISFNHFVRPVCLPSPVPQDNHVYNPQSTLKTVDLRANVEGIFSFHNASQTVLNLTILPPDECRSKIVERRLEKYYPSPDLSFCAKSSSASCTNVASPVLQSHLTGDGTRTWTQVGFADWSKDCTYVLSPRFEHLMPWVQAMMAATSEE